ncbi:hypothetical protein [Rhizohabitans arisaemae]|uniref:hypothetical protein n=1 Tax=Rhizohabitans arisaemae TaxID=2720610 RepID=UPI0024B21E1E|nr:hypothetical protein [Rhizohabitans arisaemae]
MSVYTRRSNVNPDEPLGHPVTVRPQSIRTAGVLLAVGATAWAAGTVIVGEKIKEGIQTLDTVTGMMFMTGIFAFVWTVFVTRGTGDRLGRVIPAGLLIVAPCAFLLNLFSFGYATHDEFPLPLMILDVSWPLGMAGMLVQGIAVAVVGRYRGWLRWLPLLGGLWFPVSMVSDILGGSNVSIYVSAAWLLLTYVQIGIRLAVRPSL